MSIHPLNGSSPSLEVMMAMVREQYPGAKQGIVIVFDDEADGGTIHTHWKCSDQQMALALVRLAALVNS